MIKLHHPFSLLLLGLVFTSNAQDVASYTIEEAVAHAVKHNYQLQQAQIDVAISKQKVRETTAIGLPQVNGEVKYNDFINIPTQVAPANAFALPSDFVEYIAAIGAASGVPYNPAPSDPDAVSEFQFGQKYTASAGLTASQLLFDGSYFVGLRAAKAYVDYAALGLERTESEVSTMVSRGYINAIAAQENIDALAENKRNIERIYSETTQLFETGFLEKQDADQVRLLKSNIDYQLDYARRQQASIMNLLKFQMGIPITDSIALTDGIDELIEKGSESTLKLLTEDFNPSNHVDFRTIEQGVRLSELSLSNTRAGYLPQLSAFINHSENAFRNEFDFFSGGDWYPTTVWGLQLNVPIFSSGMRHFKAQQAKLDLDKMNSQKLQLEQSLSMKAINARTSYRSAIERYEIVQEDLELARSIKERTLVKYNQGMASSTDLTQSESQYLQTLGNYINTTIELLNAKLELILAYGK